MVEVSPANADRTNVTGTATLGGATVKANFAAGSYVNKQYTIVNATGGVSGTFGSVGQHQSAGELQLEPELRRQQRLSESGAELHSAAKQRASTPTSRMSPTRSSDFFNRTGGIPLVFGGLTPAGLTQVSGETGDRLAADHLRRDGPVSWA